MTTDWVYKNGPVTIQVNREALGFVLEDFAPVLNAVAEEVAEGARKALPQPGMRKFIRVKRAGGNEGVFPLRLRGRRYGSGTGDRLMRGVEVPIALVINNSNLAMTWEYGTIPSDTTNLFGPNRPSPKKLTGPYFKQYAPLAAGAAAASRGRVVLRYKRPRGARR